MKRRIRFFRLAATAFILAVFVAFQAPLSYAASYIATTWTATGEGWGVDSDIFLMGGWEYHANPYTAVFAYGTSEGHSVEAAYCVAPNLRRTYGDSIESLSEAQSISFLNSFDESWNPTLTNAQMQTLLSYVLYYGFSGKVAEQDAYYGPITAYGMDSEEVSRFIQALATQIIVWEVIVGERDTDFSHVDPPAGKSTVKSMIRPNMPKRSEFDRFYRQTEAAIQAQLTALPSFMREDLSETLRYEMRWDGSAYSILLQDTAGQLADWQFSAPEGIRLSVDTDRQTLTVSAPERPLGDVLISAKRNVLGKAPLIYGENTAAFDRSAADVQPVAAAAGEVFVSSVRTAYMKVFANELMDPVGLLLCKVDAKTGENVRRVG